LKLKKLLKELEAIRGRHTELVSAYVPSGYSIAEVMNQIFQEKGTASNIKSKNTRKNVLTALEKIIQHLKLFKQTPPNGLVVFCGNISPVEGKDDIKLWSFQPPVKMNQKIYWCDQTFVLDPLKNLLRETEVYGLIVLDGKEANIGILKGKTLEVLKNMDSNVPSKTVKGGMSQRRYDRIIEDALNEFFTKVAEIASQLLLQQPELKGIIIGGPGPTKESFAKGNYLHYELQKKLLGVKDTGYTGEYGLQELVERSDDLMKEAAVVKERELMQKFYGELQKGGNVVYGYHETIRALEMGAVEILLVSEGFEWVHAKLRCECENEVEKDLSKRIVENQVCSKCGKKMKVEEIKELVDVFTDKAKNLGTKIEFISVNTREGMQFKELGGIGAFLRYKLS
jgi:peptide chain release factor subunit 1